MAKKTAVQKRDTTPAPRVEVLKEQTGPAYPPGRMLIASPLTIEAVVKKIRKGKVMTMGALRHTLALQHGADYTCPLTTGIFLRIVAEAAEEENAAGKRNATPYWRVVRDDGSLLDKLPGGPAAQAKALKAEGIAFTKTKRPRVADLDKVVTEIKL